MSKVRIDVWKADGKVTRLEGTAGFAVMLPENKLPTGDFLSPREMMKLLGDDMPYVANRCDNARDLALCMAAVQAYANHVGGPQVALFATFLSMMMDAGPTEKPR